MLEKSSLFQVRDGVPGDRNFILATWLRGLRYGNDWYEAIPSDIYFGFYHNVVEALLSLPGTTIRVACLKEDPDTIIGYSVFYKERLDWIFVKRAWRNIGIAKSLVPDGIKMVSHLTTVGKVILAKHPDIKFNPFSLN